ncbi:MAG: MarR family transcriptional regulator [Terriglobia bacterium]|jgi:DNA-binding MarR family transcriptional regulator
MPQRADPLDNDRYNDYIGPMPSKRKDEIKQGKPFESLESEVFLNLMRTADALARGGEEILKLVGLSPNQHNVLRILRGAGEQGLCCREVADRMITRDPDITRLVDRLERRGFLTRSRDSKDRRIITVRITPAGLKTLKELDKPMEEFNRNRLSHMDKADLRKLLDLLDAVRES